MRLSEKSSGSASPRFSCQRRIRAPSSLPMMDLARASAVSVTTIRRAELTEHSTSMTSANDLSIRRALEAAGVEFIDENGGGAGVRLTTHIRQGRKGEER
jgi:hypothetical protein